jgi:hypothetical protein
LTHEAKPGADTIDYALGEYGLASVQYPESYAASGAKPTNLGIVADAGEFPLPLAGGEVRIPDVSLNPNQLLSLPPLKLGSDGYLYRGFAATVGFGGDVTFKMPDGSDLEFSLYRKNGEPDPNKAA